MKLNAEFKNEEKISGYVYSTGSNFNQLSERVSGENSKNPGTKYIAGDLDVAVDEAGLNVVTVHFRYVGENTSKGKVNLTYIALKKIIDNPDKTWIIGGKDNAIKVSINKVTLAANDFIGSDGTSVVAIRNEGGFVSIVDELDPEVERNTFMADILVTKVTRIEADPERNIEEDYDTVSGAIFGNGATPVLIPVSFVVRNAGGIKHFESLDASGGNPVFTKVWGRVNCMTKKVEKVEESAFGEASVQTYERKQREYLITGTSKVPYDFGDPDVLTIEDVNKMTQDRQIMLAEVKKRYEDRKTAKASGGGNTFNPVAQIPTGGFTF